MEKIRWKKEYASGLVYLDNHRRNFLDIVNEVIEADNEGVCEEKIPMIFYRPSFYVENYFVNKEMALQGNEKLPISRYKQEHDRFTSTMIDFQKRFRHGERLICTEIGVFLKKWFENYISLFDQEGIDYMRQKGYE